MKKLTSLVEKLSDATSASITVGEVKGVITKLPSQNPADVFFNFSHNMTIGNNDSDLALFLPAEAIIQTRTKNVSFVVIASFSKMASDKKKSIILKGEVLGIDMGTEIFNLSDGIEIHYRNVNTGGATVSCNSWDGNGKLPNWTTEGCLTHDGNNSILCRCTHLTFFAILMAPPKENIPSAIVMSLSYITYVGCGLSMFFSGIALFMICFLRRGKSTQATKVLTNLFVAMFCLNLAFLVNQPLAEGQGFACVAIAAIMHYALLATFSWFFIEALYLYFLLTSAPAADKYMTKICIAGWAVPAVVVIVIGACGKYNADRLQTEDGVSHRMCWITDAKVHTGVNIGYYAVVFVFAIVVLVYMMWQMKLCHGRRETQGTSSTTTGKETSLLAILGLLSLLGITWVFAFFNYGDFAITSYYMFTILNSFQGFFLFIYYYKISKTAEVDQGP